MPVSSSGRQTNLWEFKAGLIHIASSSLAEKVMKLCLKRWTKEIGRKGGKERGRRGRKEDERKRNIIKASITETNIG